MAKKYDRITWTERDTITLKHGDQTSEDLLSINVCKTQCDYIPKIGNTVENVSSVDGAVFINAKFEPRIFDIYAQTKFLTQYSKEEIVDIKKIVTSFLLQAKDGYVELYIEKMRAVAYVKLDGQVELPEQYPGWLEFHFPFAAFDDVYFYEASDRLFRGTAKVVNRGEVHLYPQFEFSGYLENPSIMVDGTMYSYNGVISDGQVLIVDNQGQKAYMQNLDGTISNKSGNWCGRYCSMAKGITNVVVEDNIGSKFANRWRTRWITFIR